MIAVQNHCQLHLTVASSTMKENPSWWQTTYQSMPTTYRFLLKRQPPSSRKPRQGLSACSWTYDLSMTIPRPICQLRAVMTWTLVTLPWNPPVRLQNQKMAAMETNLNLA